MKNFKQRAITGLSFAAIMSAAILYSGWSFVAVFFLISLLGLLEFYKLIRSEHTSPQVVPGMIAGPGLFLLFTWILLSEASMELMLVAIPLVAMIFIRELYLNHPHPFLNIAVTLTGMIYFTLPLMLMLKIAFGFTPDDEVHYHGGIIMGCILILWASDTGAYMLGSQIGKNKLFERISPNKSWEGFAGAVLSSLLAAWVVSIWFPDLPLQDWMVIALLIVVAGTLGDLVESMLKRSVNVKDSGVLFPGHGGILDRFDGLLISMPFVFFYLWVRGYL